MNERVQSIPESINSNFYPILCHKNRLIGSQDGTLKNIAFQSAYQFVQMKFQANLRLTRVTSNKIKALEQIQFQKYEMNKYEIFIADMNIQSKLFILIEYL